MALLEMIVIHYVNESSSFLRTMLAKHKAKITNHLLYVRSQENLLEQSIMEFSHSIFLFKLTKTNIIYNIKSLAILPEIAMI